MQSEPPPIIGSIIKNDVKKFHHAIDILEKKRQEEKLREEEDLRQQVLVANIFGLILSFLVIVLFLLFCLTKSI